MPYEYKKIYIKLRKAIVEKCYYIIVIGYRIYNRNYQKALEHRGQISLAT